VVRQIIIELVSDAVQLWETGPGNSGEVMVLVVQADVVRQDVERAVVRISLWDRYLICGVEGRGLGLFEDVVFSNEVACTGMQASRQEGAEDQVSHCFSTDELGKNVVKDKLHHDVEEVDLGHWELVYEHRTQCVEENLESGEEGFASDRVEEEGFEGGGEVGVEAVDAKRFVVGEMVGL